MRLFVTGGTGFLGSHFLRTCLLRKWSIFALRRSKSSTPKIQLPQQPEWIDGNLEDDWARQLEGCDVLVHLAAVGVSPKSVSWDKAFLVNVAASLQLFERAVAAGVRRLVIAGSCFEYGRSGERYEFIPPDAPLEPVGPYATSKAASTIAAIGLANQAGVGLTVLRPFGLFGTGADPASFWGELESAALAGRNFRMTPGEQIRDFMRVEEAAEAFADVVAEANGAGKQIEIRNLGSGRTVRLADFARSVWQDLGAKGQLEVGALPYRPGEVMRYVPLLP